MMNSTEALEHFRRNIALLPEEAQDIVKSFARRYRQVGDLAGEFKGLAHLALIVVHAEYMVTLDAALTEAEKLNVTTQPN